MKHNKIITFLTDNVDSWIIPTIKDLTKFLRLKKHSVNHISNYKNINEGDILFILSCEKIIPEKYLKYNTYNVVIHPSKLPYGKGWSPIAWQILENKNKIYFTLFEAATEVDSGEIYFTDKIILTGLELNDDIKKIQGEVIIKMVKKFIEQCAQMKSFYQKGEESYFQKRTKKDSELNINKSIKEQFNLLRVVIIKY